MGEYTAKQPEFPLGSKCPGGCGSEYREVWKYNYGQPKSGVGPILGWFPPCQCGKDK